MKQGDVVRIKKSFLYTNLYMGFCLKVKEGYYGSVERIHERRDFETGDTVLYYELKIKVDVNPMVDIYFTKTFREDELG